LGIPTVRDRVVQAALRAVLEPIFERNFAAHSCGFGPKRGCKDALRRVDTLLKQGYHWLVDADLKSYLDTIPHSGLMAQVEGKVAEGKVLGLMAAYLTAKVLETAQGWVPDEGTPKAPSSARCSPISISTRWIISWRGRGMRRCGTRTTVRHEGAERRP
jgi:RNA-directed DNA polymerase